MSHAKPQSWSERLYIFFTGICMGAADVVPGVSGGTMAFIMGVYEDLLDGIHAFNFSLIRNVLARRFREAMDSVPVQFLALLGGGIVVAIFSLAKGIKYLYDNEQVLLFAFFFGLIVASVAVLGRSVPWNRNRMISVVCGTVIGVLIVTLTPHHMPHSPPILFMSGAIAIMAMILPGISGSFLLLILGQYAWVLEQANVIREALGAGDVGLLIRTGLGVLPLALGAVVGLLAFARLLRWILARWHWVTVAGLIGFMVGSLRKIWPWREPTRIVELGEKEMILADRMVLPGWNGELAAAVGLALAGFVLILAIESIQRRKPAVKEPVI
jgi:putative membrane protein